MNKFIENVLTFILSIIVILLFVIGFVLMLGLGFVTLLFSPVIVIILLFVCWVGDKF